MDKQRRQLSSSDVRHPRRPFQQDNTDIRYANKTKLSGKELVYGMDLNNNPTLEDLWNSTPAWGYPWIASDVAPTPNASAIINGSLAQDVAGIGGFAMWNDHLYLDLAHLSFGTRGGSAAESRSWFSIQHRRGCAILARRLAGINRDDAI